MKELKRGRLFTISLDVMPCSCCLCTEVPTEYDTSITRTVAFQKTVQSTA